MIYKKRRPNRINFQGGTIKKKILETNHPLIGKINECEHMITSNNYTYNKIIILTF